MSEIKFSVVGAGKVAKAGARPPVLVIGASAAAGKVEVHGSENFDSLQLAALGVTGKPESITRTLGTDGSAYAILGLGEGSPDTDTWRELGGALGRALGDVENIEVRLPLEDVAQAEALVLGIELGAYEYKAAKAKSKRKLKAVAIRTELALSKAGIAHQQVLAAAVWTTRDLSGAPANLVYPQEMARVASEVAEAHGIACQIWDEKQLKKDGFGLIAAVGMGSVRPPRLVKLTYAPKGAIKHLSLVGKGITFDTGGLAVKPLTGMLGMKYDMTGAATVMAAIQAIAALKLPIKVTAYLCLAENMPSGSAMRPGDVFKARNGKTVEVTNPDAEGRLVLADGLSAASEERPDLIVDVATLTGAARVALGIRYTGLMGSASGVAALQNAATDAGEPVWHMPLAKELRAAIDSPIADLQNSKVGSTFGGMLVGGWFIHEFIGNKADGTKLEWAHLDIAGPADNEGAAYGYTPQGPTGVMVRTLVSLAEQLAAK